MAAYQPKADLQAKIVAIVSTHTADSEALLQGYIREALRKSYTPNDLCHLPQVT